TWRPAAPTSSWTSSATSSDTLAPSTEVTRALHRSRLPAKPAGLPRPGTDPGRPPPGLPGRPGRDPGAARCHRRDLRLLQHLERQRPRLVPRFAGAGPVGPRAVRGRARLPRRAELAGGLLRPEHDDPDL